MPSLIFNAYFTNVSSLRLPANTTIASQSTFSRGGRAFSSCTPQRTKCHKYSYFSSILFSLPDTACQIRIHHPQAAYTVTTTNTCQITPRNSPARIVRSETAKRSPRNASSPANAPGIK